jgi:hypothetical protein
MRRIWLGDALDFWKGTFLDVLRSSLHPPRSVRVLPMFNDAGWTAKEIDSYASILGVPPAALLSTARLTKPTRKSYFSAWVQLDDDVFVDPDTGVATARPELSHVTPSEVFAMLSADNVVAVYQHRPRGDGAEWLARYVQLLSDTATGAATIGYESAQVGMLFVTKSPERKAAVRLSLALRLGAVAVARGPIPSRILERPEAAAPTGGESS